MTLSYDVARCAGTTHEVCQTCRRREPGRAEWQTHIAPTKEAYFGYCRNWIAPVLTFQSDGTSSPNEKLTGAGFSASR